MIFILSLPTQPGACYTISCMALDILPLLNSMKELVAVVILFQIIKGYLI